jgi:hypothetical protein
VLGGPSGSPIRGSVKRDGRGHPLEALSSMKSDENTSPLFFPPSMAGLLPLLLLAWFLARRASRSRESEIFPLSHPSGSRLALQAGQGQVPNNE